MGAHHDGLYDSLATDIVEACCGVGYSGPTHQVSTFSGHADGLHTGEILQVAYTGDSTVAWSSSLHSMDRDPRFTAQFLKSFQKAMGTQLSMSIAFHPQTDGQSEWTIKILEDMLRACVLVLKGSWEEHLSLVEFAYNNSYQASNQMAPYEALYGRPCRSPICWTEVGESSITGLDLIRDTSEKVGMIRKCLLTAQSRQKSYADVRRRPLEFKASDHVFLKVMPKRGVIRFGKQGKLSSSTLDPSRYSRGWSRLRIG